MNYICRVIQNENNLLAQLSNHFPMVDSSITATTNTL